MALDPVGAPAPPRLVGRRLQLTVSLWMRRRAAPQPGAMMEVTKITKYSGTVDEAIEYLVVHGGSQAAAAREKDCDPVALCRTIIRLKDADAWDDHVIDIMKRSNVEPATSGQKRDLDMPTPKSLGKQIKAGANRLGDGRPYCSKGNTWGEYREGLKIGSAAVAAAGGSVANAVAASERLAEAGVHIGKSTLHAAANEGARRVAGQDGRSKSEAARKLH
jgi:hypothetical protein